MKLPISKRLLCCAAQVPRGAQIADIGCDHGYLSIHLLRTGQIAFAHACDLREKPLQRAMENALRFGVAEKMRFSCADGLQAVDPEQIDTVVCAGMGGDLIAQILRDAPWLRDGRFRLILQPQSDLDAVREYLHRTGFVIVREEMVFEEGKYYPMMKAVHGENTDDRKIWFLYGRLLLENHHPVLKSYLLQEYDSCCKLLEKLGQTATVVAGRRCQELLEKKKLIEEALDCYR